MIKRFVKFNEDNNKPPYNIWFDLDGVLADMESALNKDTFIIQYKKELNTLIETKFIEYEGLSNDDIKAKFKIELTANPNSEVKELKKAYNNYTNRVFKVAATDNFYLNLPLIEGAEIMINTVIELTGKKPNILSSPVGDEMDPNNKSVKEKKLWIQKHFSDRVDQIVISTHKEKYASPNSILIDDRTKYVNQFKAHGGLAILHTDYKTTIEELKKLI